MDPQRPSQSSTRATPTVRRRRHSRRTYVVRRAVVLVVFLGVLYGVVTVIDSLVGGDIANTSAARISPNSTTVGTLTSADGSSGASVGDPTGSTSVDTAAPTTSTTSTTSTTIVDTNTVPTAADPARVLLLGDSEAGGLSPFLENVLDDTGIVAMDLDYKSSTGLVRPDYFDWPARLRAQVPVVNPDIVVALFGGNDGQGFPNTTHSVDSPEWRAEYGKRVSEVVEILAADGRTLIWVGVPNGESEDLTERLAVQNEVVKAELAKHPDVVFVDAWDRFTGIDGGFAPNVVDPRDGTSKPVRSETDGFHLNTVGEEILAFDVGTAVIAALRERGATL